MGKIKVKAVSFDFWGTLYFDTIKNFKLSNKIRESYLKEILDKNNIEHTPLDLELAIQAEGKEFYRVWLHEHRTIIPKERLRISLNSLNISLTDDSFDKICEKMKRVVLKRPPTLAPGVVEVIKTLKENKLRLGIISDTGYATGDVLMELMERDGLLKYFDAFSFSDETGVAKPQPKAYDHLMKELSLTNVKDVLHIGDLERTDIEGALNIGMPCCKYIGSSQKPEEDKVTRADFCIDNWLDLLNIINF